MCSEEKNSTDVKKYWIVIVLTAVVAFAILFLNIYDILIFPDVQETTEEPLREIDPYEQMLASARSEQNPEIAKLYYLNIINNNPNKTTIFQEYLDYLQSTDAPEQEYRNLASFTYLAMMQASPEILQVLFQIYQSAEAIIDNQFMLEEEESAIDKVESQALTNEFSLSIQKVLSLENSKEFDFEECYNLFNEVIYVYQLLQNPTKEQETQLLGIQNAFEILQLQEVLLGQITGSIRYDNEAFLKGYTPIMQQYENMGNAVAEFSLLKHPFQNTIEKRTQLVQDKIKIIQARYLKLQIEIIETRRETLKRLLKITNLSNSKKTEYLQGFKIFIQQRQSLVPDETFSKAIEISSAIYLNEFKAIEQSRLQAYQLWAYQAIVATDTLLEEKSKKTDLNSLAKQIDETGFLSINIDNLISQIFTLHENTSKSMMTEYKKPEDKTIIEYWISKNLRTGLKTLEDF